MRGGLRSLILYVALGCLGVFFIPNLPPFDIDFEEKIVKAVPWTGAVAPNKRMEESLQTLSKRVKGAQFGEIKGPESFAVKDGYLYTGIQGGDIIRINLAKDPINGEWETVFFGTPCKGQYQELICGRPLGMTFHPKEKDLLVVADSNHGLYSINVVTKVKTTLVPFGLEVAPGKPNMLTNSVAVAKDGTIYYTISSTKFVLGDGVFEFISAGSGTLMRYNLVRNTSEVLVSNLAFANGLALSDKEDYILFSEVATEQVHKYYLAGSKVGTSEVLLQVPGAPDNIKSNGKGGFLVGVILAHKPEGPSPVQDFILPYPKMARFIVRILYYWQQLFAWADRNLWEFEWLQKAAYLIGNFEPGLPSEKYGMVLEINGESGKVIQSWHHTTGEYGLVCEAVKVGEWLYLGSPYNYEVSRIKY